MKVKGSTSILQNPSIRCNFSNTIMAARLESPLPLWLYQYPTNLNGLLLRRGMLFTRRRTHTVCARSTHTHTHSQRLLCDTEQVAESTQFCRGAKAIFLSRFFFLFLFVVVFFFYNCAPRGLTNCAIIPRLSPLQRQKWMQMFVSDTVFFFNLCMALLPLV